LKSHKKKKIIECYNNSSHFYDERYNLIQREKFEFTLKRFNYSEKYILDAGCGTGLLYEFISLNKNDILKRFISIDISFEMLKHLKKKQKFLKKKILISPILSDIENMPIRNDIFDAVISFTSFQNLENVKKGFLEIVRVLKSGGEVNISILKKDQRIHSLLAFVKPFLHDLYESTVNNLEDTFIKGKVLK
jgi:ubiquinone/menaquinone biosynthesis C-methylase UbiE